MGKHSSGHGCPLIFAILGYVATTTLANDAVRVQSRVFEIDFVVNEAALPLETVQLWYTLDRGVTWHQYGFDEDRQSPFTFHAPAEGLYGLFLRVSNTTGPSSQPPAKGTQPHQWAFVDFTPPVVQLHALRQTTLLGQRVVQIRWTAIDAHLTPRPVQIEYQSVPDDRWRPLTPDPLANTGRYDWRLPEDLVGTVAVRAVVVDKGGHRVESERQVIEVARRDIAQTKPNPIAGSAGAHPGGMGGAPILHAPDAAKQRASRLMTEALVYRDRSDYQRGIMRLREVVKLDPQRTEAFAEMGAMLYLLGDFDRALNAFEVALSQQAAMRPALRGAAMVYRQKHNYALASDRLRTILRYNPNDAETWMNLGDIGIYQGDEILARECYLRATRIDPAATEVIEEARKRLALMAQVSRTYQEQGSNDR